MKKNKAQRRSSCRSSVRPPAARPGIVQVILEQASAPDAAERLRRAYEMILLAGGEGDEEVRTGSSDAQKGLEDD